ncbi:MAG: DUF1284 domain-containing protein [Coriobacteriales bacterium]|nr:DUF1284 domain-containing protein [Coriobacteriales bacterium]
MKAPAAGDAVVPEPLVRLRGHHLICLQFFRGEGYSEDFVENLTAALSRLENEPATVVEGADDVCAACPSLSADGLCVSDEAGGEDEIRLLDALALEGLGVGPGDEVRMTEVRTVLAEDGKLVARWRSVACEGCEWARVCESGWERLGR